VHLVAMVTDECANMIVCTPGVIAALRGSRSRTNDVFMISISRIPLT